MRVTTLLIVVISGFTIVNCTGESRKIDEVQYKNHRTSSNRNNDTSHKTYPVYPAQVYANLSNVRDFGAAIKPYTEQPQLSKDGSKTTETSTDVVRMFFTTPTAGKRKSPQDTAASTTPVPATGSVFRTAAPSTYIVTAKNAITSSPTESKSPIYSVPNRSWTEVKEAVSATQDFRGVPTGDELKFKTKLNGTKIRRILKTQNQATQSQSQLYAATTSSPPFTGNQRNSTAYAASGKVNATGIVLSSKPFATVLVPRHVLEGGVLQNQQQHVQHQQQQVLYPQQQQVVPQQQQQVLYQQQQQVVPQKQQQVVPQKQQQVLQQDSFRPIAAPMFTQYKSSNGVAVATNSIVDNDRRVLSDAKTVRSSTNRPVVQKPTKYGFAKPLTYKVEEYVPGDGQPSVYGGNDDIEQDRSDRVSVTAEKRETGKQHKYMYYESAPRQDGPAPASVVEPFNSDGSGPLQFREFYQATEWPAADKYEKFDTRSQVRGPPLELAPKEFGGNRPVNRYPLPVTTEAEPDGPEFVMGDQSPKEVLKYLLRDMLKQSKRPVEVKPKSPDTMADDIVDSYFGSNRQNVDSTLQDIYDIQSDMNCNLRSTKYITDGQCVSTKPVVEVVCADRCLVAANSLSHRHRSSMLDNQQVEALQCVDGDLKMVRVQLKCRDGNMFNNVIKVVTNCRCKLHPTQPQMRSNTPRSRLRDSINPDIMDITAGRF